MPIEFVLTPLALVELHEHQAAAAYARQIAPFNDCAEVEPSVPSAYLRGEA